MVRKYEERKDLFCPRCSNEGMHKLKDRAQSGRTRYACPQKACRFRTTQTLYTKPQILPKTKISEIKKHKRFIITSAVNDTPLVKEAHETFKKMAEELGACYLIIPGVYKNPDLKHLGATDGYTWPEEILPYLCNADVELNKNICIRATTRISHTSINPLSGMNHAGGIQSEVFGHSQVAMEMVATAKEKIPKMMHTTGTVSQMNYGGSKTAKKASFHHSISALLIELEGDSFWPHELHFDGEGVALYDTYYTPKSVRKTDHVAGLVFGDTHVYNLNPKINTLHEHIRKTLKPVHEVYHDLHDQHIGSHHNDKNLIFKMRKSLNKEWCIRKELMKSVDFLKNKPDAVIVDSNHNRHLDQWFNRFNPQKDQVNIELYFELAEMLREDLNNNGDGDLFRLFIQKYGTHEYRFVNGNELFEIKGIDCSQHGDRGPNGSRGSARSFSKTGHKTIIGHSHTPAIEKGCYQVGTSTTDLDYAVGYSSWVICSAIIYSNGKRGLFNIIKGKLSPLMRKMTK